MRRNNKMRKITEFLESVDNEILSILESSVTHYGKCLWDTEFIFNNKQIIGKSSKVDISQSALDYLASKVKFLFLQTLFLQMSLLEDDLYIKKNHLNTNEFASYMVLDSMNNEMKKATSEEIKEMKYGISKLDEHNSFNGTQAIFRDYHDNLRKTEKLHLREYFTKRYKYTEKGSFIDNVEYQFSPSVFVKKDLAFLYAESKDYYGEVQNKIYYYLDKHSPKNFYYISFLINEFGKKSTIFKCSNNFFSYILSKKNNFQEKSYDGDNKKKSKTSISHKQHSRDFKTMINKYNKHVTSANSYLEKLVCSLNQEITTGISKCGSLNTDITSLINFYILTNYTLRSDFFSSINSIYIQNMLKKISIEILYKNIAGNQSNEEEIQHTLIYCFHSIDTYIHYTQGLNIELRQLFNLKLLELLMLFNVDTNQLSKLSFYNQRENSNKLSTEEQLHLVSDSYELLYILERIIYDFLSRSYLSIPDFLNKGIKLFTEIKYDKLFSNTLKDELMDYYNIKLDLDKSEYTYIMLNTISESTCKLYKNAKINEELIIAYLFNACGRNRIIDDYFYYLPPRAEDSQIDKKDEESNMKTDINDKNGEQEKD